MDKHNFEINKILIEPGMFYPSTFYRPIIDITPAGYRHYTGQVSTFHRLNHL
ncbi:MAG: hypothetical protein ACLPSL_01515 [Smithella sp.]